MSKTEYTAEDFVLDPEFRKWVLSPNETDNAYWEEYLRKNPSKYQELTLARKILLNIAREAHEVSEDRIENAWENIAQAVDKMDPRSLERKAIPLNALSTIKRHEQNYRSYSEYHQLYRMAGMLLFAFALALTVSLLQPKEQVEIVEAPIIYEDHYAPPGVKSSLTLQDGSKVILNSGSTLRYIKNFEPGQRVLELVGEAYFEVAKDSLRPFMVQTGSVTIKALGTSFNISAYENEELDISLLSGLVEVDLNMDRLEKINLIPGEELNVNLKNQKIRKRSFDDDKLLAWTRKTIIFDHTPIARIRRVLENWYGVQIGFANSPAKDLIVSGIFRDQTLENVLIGLSYSTRFEFDIDKDKVTLTFKK